MAGRGERPLRRELADSFLQLLLELRREQAHSPTNQGEASN